MAKKKRRRIRRHTAANPRKRRPRRSRRRVITVYAANPRKHHRRTHRRNPAVRQHRRRYRRNPSIGTRGFVNTLMQGAKDGFAVTLGSGLNNYLVSKIPFGTSTDVGKSALQLLVGTLSGMVVKKLTRSDRFAAFYVAGAYSNVIRQAMTKLPTVGPSFAGIGTYYQGVGTYYQGAPRLSSWAGSDGASIATGNGSGYAPSEDMGEEQSYMMA